MAARMAAWMVCGILVGTAFAIRPDTEEPWYRAGDLADEILTMYLNSTNLNLPSLFERLKLDIKHEYFSFKQVFWTIAGLRSVEEVAWELHDTADEHLFQAFKICYATWALRQVIRKKHLLYMEQFYPYPWIQDDLALIRVLESSGLSQLEPGVVAGMIDVYAPETLPEPEPISTLPLEAQCKDLTNMLRKVWNRAVSTGSGSGPGELGESRAAYRSLLYNMTGIYLPRGPDAHRTVLHIVCSTLESSSVRWNGLESLYEYLLKGNYISFYVSYVYNVVVNRVRNDYLHDYVENPPYDYYGNPTANDDHGNIVLFDEHGNVTSSIHHDDSDDEITVKIRELVNILHGMGLLDLQLMVDMYPHPR